MTRYGFLIMKMNQVLINLNTRLKKYQETVRNGGPKIYVDVISKVHDSQTDIDYYIRTKNIYIERTD